MASLQELYNDPDAKKILENFSLDKLLLILQKVQEKYGYIPREIMLELSKTFNIPLSQIYSVVTFYNEFKLYKKGKYVFRVCLGTACSVKHNDNNLEFLQKLLGIKPGNTTNDGLFTLETVNCLGACSLAPVVEINGKIFPHMTPEKLKKLIEKLRRKSEEAFRNKQ